MTVKKQKPKNKISAKTGLKSASKSGSKFSGDEFSIIHDLFAPLSANAPGAFNLSDDVGVLDEARLVVTKDLLIEGVHFRPRDPLDLVAQKLMRVNISDLVAKGVRPTGYFLGCAWPAKTTRAMIEKFVTGLANAQAEFKISLMGGDTTKHKSATAPLTLSATFYGVAASAGPTGGIVRRSGAKVADDLYVTGTIGDAGLGLGVLEGHYKPAKIEKDFLKQRYQLPTPRIAFGSAINSFATAAIDVSDGLLADCGHIEQQSEVGVHIDLSAIPLSKAAHDWVHDQEDYREAMNFLMSCGDDYEILFTAPKPMARSVAMAARASRTQVTKIGLIRRGHGVHVLDDELNPIEMDIKGFNHFG